MKSEIRFSKTAVAKNNVSTQLVKMIVIFFSLFIFISLFIFMYSVHSVAKWCGYSDGNQYNWYDVSGKTLQLIQRTGKLFLI